MPTPKIGRVRKIIPSEHAEQAALFDWWNLQHADRRELLFAIPNGGSDLRVVGRQCGFVDGVSGSDREAG